MTQDRIGGRTIELLIPYEHQGRKIEVIHLKPIMFDHMLRWQQGAFASSLVLLVAISGETESTLRMLRYPDVDRVLDAMMSMLPDAIRQDIVNGVIPKGPAPPAEIPETMNGPAAPEPTLDQPFAGIDK